MAICRAIAGPHLDWLLLRLLRLRAGEGGRARTSAARAFLAVGPAVTPAVTPARRPEGVGVLATGSWEGRAEDRRALGVVETEEEEEATEEDDGAEGLVVEEGALSRRGLCSEMDLQGEGKEGR